MGQFLVCCHRLIFIVLSLCKHACKEVCDVKQGVDPHPSLARSCDRRWPDFVTFTACKRSIFGFKRGKKAQCISNRCKDLFKRKKYFGDMGTLRIKSVQLTSCNCQSLCTQKNDAKFQWSSYREIWNKKHVIHIPVPSMRFCRSTMSH